MKTHFTWLDAGQKYDFRGKRDKLRAQFLAWDNQDLYHNKKTLEDEVKDLEKLSFEAFKSMKLLKKILSYSSGNDFILPPASISKNICIDCQAPLFEHSKFCTRCGKRKDDSAY